MRSFVALDVSLEKTAIRIMSAGGPVVTEVTAASDPKASAAELARQEAVGPDALLGLKAGPLSEWIARGMAQLPRAWAGSARSTANRCQRRRCERC